MSWDAVVVGAGPNGLAAALRLAGAGCRVLVLEAAEEPGGGVRTGELTLPGFRHDLCSAVHPLAAASPFLRRLPLERHGLAWIQPPLPLAHPLDGEPAACLHRSLEKTIAGLGPDGEAWGRTVAPLLEAWEVLFDDLLGPLRWPSRPLPLLRFASTGLLPWAAAARRILRTSRGRALLAGLGAHSILPPGRAPGAAVSLVLGVAAHAVGWPFPRGGAGRLTAALVSLLEARGGEVRCGVEVRSLRDLPPARAVLFDVSPRALCRIARERLPAGYRERLNRYRHGPGVFKLDWALDAPIPWRDPACARAGTVHLGGTLDEVAAAERAPWRGRLAERPFVLLAQPSLFDPERAPDGRHTAWAYCHVPAGWGGDATARVEAQVERFAPGFADRVAARSATGPAELEARNPNYVGGDINGGVQDLGQLFFRPAARLDPYATPDPALYLCSSATPPGGGVHGMCGYHAAGSALRRVLDRAGARRTGRGALPDGGP